MLELNGCDKMTGDKAEIIIGDDEVKIDTPWFDVIIRNKNAVKWISTGAAVATVVGWIYLTYMV